MIDRGYRMAHYSERSIFEIGDDVSVRSGERDLRMPNLRESEVVRHFVRLSQMNYSVDTGFYPLGSCTMKFTPRILEYAASRPGFSNIHPEQPVVTAQGALALMWELERMLAVIGGMDAVTLQPAAGAHGEYTGMLLARAYHSSRGEERDEVIVPDTAHGTNPASAAMAGYKVVEIPSNKDGAVDIEALGSAVSERTAALMLTNPNTLGIFEPDATEIARIAHDSGALVYYDGANLNAIMGITDPGAMGFDIVHFNLHKTFGTPHGGGGPGSGPVGVVERLEPFLPAPRIIREEGGFRLTEDRPESIGRVQSFYGNFLVMVKAYAYIKLLGRDLRKVSEMAVLNSNYLAAKLSKVLPMPFSELRKHEFVISGEALKDRDARALDVAKRLGDYGFHAPTIYFPLIVKEAMMVEPTETESKETLDGFADAISQIANEGHEVLHDAPTAVSPRVDETKAARKMMLTWDLAVESGELPEP